MNVQSLDDLYVLIGYGKISAHQIVNKFMPEKEEEVGLPKPLKVPKVSKSVISIKGIDDVLYQIGKCCMPVPGDRIVGFITRGKGITIHRRECYNLEKLAVDNERWIEVEWSHDGEITSQARVYVETIDKP